jgi:pimeloyl-ACP methyl ester carboxylesterase
MGTAGPPAGQVIPVVVHDGLAVYRIGHGRPILLMPGLHRFEWPGLPVMDALINSLTGIGHQVITFDPPGSGYSTRPARLGMAELHQCTKEALDACERDAPVDAIGHSMGGLALLGHVLNHPARIGRVVLVGTGPAGGPTGTLRARYGGAATRDFGRWPRWACCTSGCGGWPPSGC